MINKPMRRTRVIATLVLCGGLAGPVWAVCPPGMYQPPGAGFCVPGNATPVYVPTREEKIQALTSIATQGEITNPMQGRVDAIAKLLELEGQGMKRVQAALDADPKLRELAKGWWEYFGADPDKKRTYGCAAAYVHLNGVVLLSEAPGYKEAVITLLGVSIPRPEQPRKVTATIDQDDGKPQHIKVLNYAVPGSKVLGAVAFEVPTLQLLLETMEEKQTFDISLDKTSVVRVQWREGIEARDQLKKCVQPL